MSKLTWYPSVPGVVAEATVTAPDGRVFRVQVDRAHPGRRVRVVDEAFATVATLSLWDRWPVDPAPFTDQDALAAAEQLVQLLIQR